MLFIHDDALGADEVEEQQTQMTKTCSVLDTNDLRHMVTEEIEEDEEYSNDFDQTHSDRG